MNYSWAPIETAPKDGRLVSLANPKEGIFHYYHWDSNKGDWYIGLQNSFNKLKLPIVPTHWIIIGLPEAE